MMKMNFHQDVTKLHVNTLPPHAYFIPFSKRSAALSGNRESSDRFLSLNGEWNFTYGESYADLPEEFNAESLIHTTIKVPSVWQAEGFESQQYTNFQYPIPFDPPYVPHANPYGIYSRVFEYHPHRGGKRTLVFEGVDSCFYLWINDSFVGYSQVSHCISEFDITELLKDGENRITVMVLKWCDGTYLEDQDKFRTSGIFRDVYILERSASRFVDYSIMTKLLRRGASARVIIDAELTGVAKAEYVCYDESGDKIASGSFDKGRAVFPISNVTLWNAENPYLYTLLLSCGGEYICEKFGVREVSVVDGVLKINGQAVKFHGVNRQDFDPVSGPAVTLEHMERDLRMMKRHNINAIRTGHYPNAPEFLKLCDRMGFYVVAEADCECHGVNCRNGHGSLEEDYNWIADNDMFDGAILDRVQRSVLRDKNRVSVVIWSMGNECGYGPAFEKAIAWTRHFDTTRLTHYERAAFPHEKAIEKNLPDLYSRMYPSVEEIDQYLEENSDSRPYMLCEYAHAMGNGPGDLESYFNCFHRHERHCGGFVWEWCDQAFDMGRDINGHKRYFYGGDFEDRPNDGNFCVDGLVSPERVPHTGLMEYKNVNRPVRVLEEDLEKGEFWLWNLLDFTMLSEVLYINWTIRQNGRDVYTGTLDGRALDIEPHKKQLIRLEYPKGLKGPFAIYFESRRLFDTTYAKAGEVLGYEQLGRQRFILPPREEGILTLEVIEKGNSIVIDGENFHYVFDRDKVSIMEMNYSHLYLIEKPIILNIWRAPTDNDRFIREKWEAAGYDRAIVRGYETEIEMQEDHCVLRTRFSIGAVSRSNFVEGVQEIAVDRSGAMNIHIRGTRRHDAPPLPRFGIRMMVPKRVSGLEYFGYGPYESYRDMHMASTKTLYRTNVEKQYVDYLRPQEHGSHFNCDYLNTIGTNGGIEFVGEGFSFNASKYTQEELVRRKHNYELQDSGSTVLCIDAFQNGIGSNSCGPALAQRYESPEQIDFNVTICPYFGIDRITGE